MEADLIGMPIFMEQFSAHLEGCKFLAKPNIKLLRAEKLHQDDLKLQIKGRKLNATFSPVALNGHSYFLELHLCRSAMFQAAPLAMSFHDIMSFLIL